MRTPEAVAAMPCPVCKTSLSMSDRSGVEIDYCPTCRGVWLDRGELDKIIERTSAQNTPQEESHIQRGRAERPANKQGGIMGMAAKLLSDDDDRYDDRDHDRRYGKRKKKKSMLSEFFD